MKLKNYIDQLIGKRISISILNSKLFPFGFTDRDSELILKEHSIGFYMVILDGVCVFMFDTTKVNQYKVEILDEEISVIEWKDIRIVSSNNI